MKVGEPIYMVSQYTPSQVKSYLITGVDEKAGRFMVSGLRPIFSESMVGVLRLTNKYYIFASEERAKLFSSVYTSYLWKRLELEYNNYSHKLEKLSKKEISFNKDTFVYLIGEARAITSYIKSMQEHTGIAPLYMLPMFEEFINRASLMLCSA